VLQFPQLSSLSTRFQGFSADENCPGPVIDATGPTGSSQLIAKPDGSKFYVLGSAGIQSVDPSFTAFRTINGIAGTPTSMAISPDGRYLYVGATGLFILDTATDTVLTNGVPITGTVVGTVFSADSKFAYVLTDSVLGSAVAQVNTSTRLRVGQPLNLPFGCGNDASGRSFCSITMSPLQLIYITNGGYIFEIDPVAMAVTANGSITTNISTLGPLRFTADGSVAFAVNRTPNIGGRVMLKFTPSNHGIAEWFPFNTGVLSSAFLDIFPASPSRVFAVSSVDTTLWDVNTTNFGAVPSTSIPGLGVGVNNTLSATLSNEQPSARYLYLLVANGNQTNFTKVDLATNAILLQSLASLGAGTFQFLPVPPQTGAVSFLQFNNNQTIKAGGASAPLAAVVLNGAGVPLYNVPVTYSVDTASGITISGASQITNKDGYVQATATMPTTPGTYVVTLTAGSATATFNLTVPGSSGGGGGGGGSSSQITIVGGNGMLLYPFQPLFNTPLMVKLVDQAGKPLVNAQVSFTIVSGPGQIDTPIALTDQNGFASTNFIPQTPQQGNVFQTTDVNASSAVGAVDFVETTYQLNLDGTGQPQVSLVSPGGDSNYTINAGAGDLIPSAVIASIFSSIPPVSPIPNIGIRLASSADFTQPAPASCKGSSLSDNNGTAHCDIQVGCQLGTNGMSVVIGELRVFQAILKIGPGTSQALAKVSGDNQSGQAGQALGQTLVARITDNCGNAISGAQVTWKVTQGSATLGTTNSVSDSGGNVSTKVTLGQTPGAIQITATLASGTKVTFTATVNVVVSSLTLVSGNNQSALTNQGFAQPLFFAVKDNTGNPVQGIQVNFSVVSGSATLSAPSATTNSSGQVSVNVTAGGTPGPVVISGTASTFTATATLTVNAPGPVITSASFTNYASNQQGLTACGLGKATGPGIAPTINGVVLGNPLGLAGPLPYTIVSTSITVNGIPAPLVYLSNQNGVQQAAFQTPCETITGAATIAVTVGGATTTVTGVQVATQPGIFSYAGPNNKSYGQVIRGLDGSYVSPSNLARRGETYYMVATGLGQTTPPALTNAAGAGQSIPTSQVVVGLNNAGVPVISVQYVAIGVYYVGFQIPLNAQQGNDQNLALGAIVGGQTIYDNQSALIPGVQ
jgi:uncharacterized protein (TIGR03437 family)